MDHIKNKEKTTFHKIQKKAVTMSDLPPEVAMNLPKVTTVFPYTVEIENIGEILTFSDTLLEIGIKDAIVVIAGEGFVIKEMDRDHMILWGTPTAITYCKRSYKGSEKHGES